MSVLAVAGLMVGLMSAASPASASPSCTKNLLTTTRSGWIVAVPAASSSTPLHCHLQQGYVGAAVRTLQNSIAWCYRGYNETVLKITVDGNFGPKTKAALKRVQQIEGVTADGVYGPQTRDAMKHRQVAWEGDQDPNVCRELSW
ncbi:peptidoglycan-binding domain-containing protein [Mumia sp. DW29H23]|uniref:peptidoglycan-binding domain-containing protein n=1 Tax=Mumia sp. DW29H23 TaxID=3421241 RepID=UPI003D685B20